MTKRILSFVLVFVMAACMLLGCSKKEPLTAEEAQQVALDAANLTAEDVSDMHVHTGALEDGTEIYSIHFTYAGQSVTCVVDANTGKILPVNVTHSH